MGNNLNFTSIEKELFLPRFGGLISLIVLSLAFYTLGLNLYTWDNFQNFKVISSSKSSSPAQLLASDQNFSFTFGHENYYLYFALSADMQNGTFLEYYDLARYFTPRMSYIDANFVSRDLPLENCWKKKQFEFLQQTYTGADDARGTKILCLKDDVLMGLMPNQTMQYILNPALIYQVVKCQNSSENNFSCASEDQIEKMLPYVTLQVSIPKSTYDFRDTENPRKRNWDSQVIHLDYNLMKWYTGFLQQSYLMTDDGIWNEHYKEKSVDFNVENIQYEVSIRNINNNDVLMKFDFHFGFNIQTYYLQNMKLIEIIGTFGGTINLLIYIGHIICTFYNQMVIKHKLINMAFENQTIFNEPNPKNKKKYTFKKFLLSYYLEENPNTLLNFQFLPISAPVY